MATAFYRHQFIQGEEYSIDVELRDENGTPIDTTNWSGVSPLYTLDRETPKDSVGDAIAFTVSFPVTGTVRLALPYAKTMQLPPKRYLYGAKLTDSSAKPVYYLQGDVIVGQGYPA